MKEHRVLDRVCAHCQHWLAIVEQVGAREARCHLAESLAQVLASLEDFVPASTHRVRLVVLALHNVETARVLALGLVDVRLLGRH